MSDQNGGKTETSETDSKPDPAPDSKPDVDFSQNRTPPVIEGDAEDITPPRDPETLEAGEPEPVLAAEPEHVEKTDESAAASEPTDTVAASAESERRGGAFRPVAVLLGAVALGGGAYYLWNAYVAEPPPAPAQIAESPPAKPAPLQMTAPPPAPAPPPKKAESDKPPPAAPAAEAPKKAEPAPESKSVAATAPEAAKPAANHAETDKALADMAVKLAAAQSAVEHLSQRLQAVESQLAAPKNDARASLSSREAGPNNAGEASARIVVAQSLLTALRQGDDYSTQLAALQNLGADPARLARLRGGLSAPSVNRLVADFAALAPQLAAAAAPPKPVEETKPPRNTGEAILAYIEAGTRKLVRVRAAGAPEKDAAALQIEKIEKDLRAGDLAAALSDREKLPAPALPLSAAWAAAAQAHLDAEAAAKAELADAMQNLTKAKS